MKILSRMMLMITALVLTSTFALAQNLSQEELKKAQESHPVVPLSYGAKAVGDDCSNPILVSVSAYPFTFNDNGQTTNGRGNNYNDTQMGSFDGGNDIVYKINVAAPGMFTFTVNPSAGWSAIGVFEGCPSTNNMLVTASNSSSSAASYTATAVLADATMDYYVMVDTWPSPVSVDFDLNISAISGQARLEAVVDPIDLGAWPVNAWQECRKVEFSSNGTVPAVVSAVELDDATSSFDIVNPQTFPYSVDRGETARLSDVIGKPTSVGAKEAVYVASFGLGKGVSSTVVKLNAYDAPTGDIFENPFVATLPYSVAGVSTSTMHKNYMPDVANNGKDVVYKFTLASDKLVNIGVANNSDDVVVKLYDETFGGKPGPMSSNAIAEADAAGLAFQSLFAGTYYVVVAGSNAASDVTFDFTIDGVDMPTPLKPFDPAPADAAMDIPANGSKLTWKFSNYSAEYRLALGTTYANNEYVVDWSPVTPKMLVQGGEYDLPALMPNMQYFWRVEVRNTSGTTVGDNWGFTTTLTSPKNLTAAVVDTNDINLSWELDLSKAFRSYNIYREGVKIKDNYTETTYKDMNLAHGCYKYEVEAVYDEGTSAKSNQVEACITGVAIAQGQVTDLNTGEPIDSAMVVIEGAVETYELYTDANGMYEAEVWEGIYHYTVSATHYASQEINITIPFNTTEVRNFQLDDDPVAWQGTIIARELSDDKVEINWQNAGSGGGGGTVGETWAEDFESGLLAEDWEIQTTNATTTFAVTDRVLNDLVPFGTYHAGLWWAYEHQDEWLITKEFTCPASATLSFAAYVFEGSTHGDSYKVNVSTDGGANWTELWNATDITGEVQHTYADPAYNVDLSAYAGQDIKVAFQAVDGDGQGLWYIFFVDNVEIISAKGTYSLSYEDGPQYKAGAMSPAEWARDGKRSSIKATNNHPTKGAKVVKGFNVYRVACFDETQKELLGYTLDSIFTDNNWGDVAWGNYKWGVETVYTNHTSPMAYSNCLDKEMLTHIDLKVVTNSGDSPAGTQVTFTNTSEPELAFAHTFVLDSTGMAAYDSLRRGVYDIKVKLDGFTAINENNVTIEDSTSFEWMLIEEFYQPFDLWVSPTGYATWKVKEVVADASINETFDVAGIIPEGWAVVDNGSTHPEYNWKVVADYKGKTMDDGTPFVIIDSDQPGSGSSMDAYLVSPAIDNSAAANVTVEFHQNFQWIGSGDYGEVDVWNGSEWVNLVKQEEDLPVSSTGSTINSFDQDDVITTLDATAHKNTEFKVRFHYAGSWDWFWAIDNVKVFDNTVAPVAAKGAKAIQGYKVWLGDVYEADTPDTWYQHDVSELTAGESYTTSVATLYSTGLSDKEYYTWTYVPCDQYEGPMAVTAERVEGTENAKVIWSDHSVAGEEWTENFDSGVLSEGWAINATNAGKTWEITDKSLNDLAPIGPYHAGLWWDYSHQDEWLITKSFVCPANATFTFSAYVFEGSTHGDSYKVNVSTDDGATWTELWNATDLSGGQHTYANPAYNLDLNAYAGQNIKMAFQAVDGDGQGLWYIFFVDNVSVSSAKTNHAIVFDELSYESKANVTGKMMTDPSVARDGSSVAIEMAAPKAPKFDKVLERVGTNVYRDGEMIAYVALPDTTYVDEGLMLDSTYRYCVAAVYTEDGGDHTFTSCIDGTCTNFTMPENCMAPSNLTAAYNSSAHKANLNWNAPGSVNFDPTWLDYGCTTNVNSIGAGGTPFAVAHKYPAGTMNEYEGGVITKVKMFIGETLTAGTIKVWQGANAEDLICAEPMNNIVIGNWNEFELATPVAFDVTQDLWVGYSVDTYSGFPAGCGDPVDANADWILFNDEWAHLPELAPTLVNSWNIGFYVDAAKGGFEPTYVTYEDNTDYTATADATLATSGVVGVNAVDPFTNAAAAAERGLLGYNVYKDGVQVNTGLVTETSYVVSNLASNTTYCFKVTAVYENCGESDFSNEVCISDDAISEFGNSVSVYPNPAKDYVKIEANSTIEQVRITNMAGQLINHIEAIGDTQMTIDTQAMGAGVYFVEVATTAGAKKVKLVITK